MENVPLWKKEPKADIKTEPNVAIKIQKNTIPSRNKTDKKATIEKTKTPDPKCQPGPSRKKSKLQKKPKTNKKVPLGKVPWDQVVRLTVESKMGRKQIMKNLNLKSLPKKELKDKVKIYKKYLPPVYCRRPVMQPREGKVKDYNLRSNTYLHEEMTNPIMKEKQKFNNEALTASIENENKKTAALRNETSEKNATLEMLTKVQKETQQFKDQSEKYKDETWRANKKYEKLTEVAVHFIPAYLRSDFFSHIQMAMTPMCKRPLIAPPAYRMLQILNGPYDPTYCPE